MRSIPGIGLGVINTYGEVVGYAVREGDNYSIFRPGQLQRVATYELSMIKSDRYSNPVGFLKLMSMYPIERPLDPYEPEVVSLIKDERSNSFIGYFHHDFEEHRAIYYRANIAVESRAGYEKYRADRTEYVGYAQLSEASSNADNWAIVAAGVAILVLQL